MMTPDETQGYDAEDVALVRAMEDATIGWCLMKIRYPDEPRGEQRVAVQGARAALLDRLAALAREREEAEQRRRVAHAEHLDEIGALREATAAARHGFEEAATRAIRMAERERDDLRARLARAEGAMVRWAGQGHTDLNETPLDGYGREVLSEAVALVRNTATPGEQPTDAIRVTLNGAGPGVGSA